MPERPVHLHLHVHAETEAAAPPAAPVPVTSITPGSSIQYGIVNKPLPGRMTILFNQPFPVIPVVLISAYLQDTDKQVPNVETINDTERDGFTIFSDNGGDDYFVTWMAIGHPDLRSTP